MNPKCTVSWNFLGYLSSLCPNFAAAVGGDSTQQLTVWFPPFPDILFHGSGYRTVPNGCVFGTKRRPQIFSFPLELKCQITHSLTGRKREGKRNHFSLQSFSM